MAQLQVEPKSMRSCLVVTASLPLTCGELGTSMAAIWRGKVGVCEAMMITSSSADDVICAC
jgi:hypothetical protein